MRKRYSAALTAAFALCALGSHPASAQPARVFDPTRDAQAPNTTIGASPEIANSTSSHFSKRTHANQSVTLAVYANVDEKCHSTEPVLSFEHPPEHGTISVGHEQTDVGNLLGPRQACSGTVASGTTITYTPVRDFLGRDEVSFKIVDGKYAHVEFYLVNIVPLGMR